MKVNFESTKILTDWCKANNKRMIYSSSAASYGTNGEYPSNLYGWSKYVAEQYVISNGGIALRYFNVYGPGEEHKGNMASMAYQMMKAGSAKLFPGKPKRDFIYVDDVAIANLHAFAHYDALSGKKYDVGLGEAHSFEYIADALDITYTYHDPSAIPEGYQFYTCSNPRNWMPGWAPEYSIKTTLQLCKTYWQKLLTNQDNGQCSSEDGNHGTKDTDG
jgi:ADP-L-glycero-D-manno-heptose 6-epimerase